MLDNGNNGNGGSTSNLNSILGSGGPSGPIEFTGQLNSVMEDDISPMPGASDDDRSKTHLQLNSNRDVKRIHGNARKDPM